MGTNFENLLDRAEAERQAGKAEAEQTQRRKAFVEQLHDDLRSLAYFERSRAIRVGGGEITDDDLYASWARELCNVGRRITKGSLRHLIDNLVPTGGTAHEVAIEVLKLACDQKYEELEHFLSRAVAVEGLWIDVAQWIYRIAKILNGSTDVPIPDGWEGALLAEPVNTLEQFRVWLKDRLAGVRDDRKAADGFGHIIRNAHRLLERLDIADRPDVPAVAPDSVMEVEAALMNLDKWTADELEKRPIDDRIRLFVDDIFPKVRGVAAEDVLGLLDNGRLDCSEDNVQKAFEGALAVAVEKKDWGGEQNDLYTSNITYEGIRLPAAFLLKGNGLKAKKLEIKVCGTTGDQIIRLFQTSAELFVLQYIGDISEMVIHDVESKAELRRLQGKRGWFCIIDGQDTARVLKAYGDL
jgi:hypothetical protein